MSETEEEKKERLAFLNDHKWIRRGRSITWIAMIIGFIVMVLAAIGYAEENKLQIIVPSKQRSAKNIIYIIDHSGSMRNRGWPAACSYSRMLTEQNTDQASFSLIIFNGTFKRWKYHGKTWVKLPSKYAINSAQSWLRLWRARGRTVLLPALKAALQDSKDPLTIVIISDGVFDDGDNEIVKKVEEYQKQRIKDKKHYASIACLAITPRSSIAPISTEAAIYRLGIKWGGGLYEAKVK